MRKNVKFNFIELVSFIILACFSIGLFNLSGLFISFLILLSIVFFIRSRNVIDYRCYLLLAFSVFFFLNHSLFWGVLVEDIIIYLLAPWSCFLLAKCWVIYSNSRRCFEFIILVLIVGFFLHGMLNFYRYVQISGGMDVVQNSPYRITYDFWRKEIIAVTGCSLYYVPLMSFSLGYLFFGNGIIKKIVSTCFICLGMWVNIVYANRTAVFLIFILLLLSVYLKLSDTRSAVKTSFILIVVVFAILLVWNLNLFDIKTTVMNLNVMQRIESTDEGRVDSWIRFLKSSWWKHPFGGDLAGEKHAHNMWLDIMRTGGFLPFLFSGLFAISSLEILYNACKIFKTEGRIYLLLCLGIYISCSVEPILQSNPYYFLILLMIFGAIDGKLNKIDYNFIKNVL